MEKIKIIPLFNKEGRKCGGRLIATNKKAKTSLNKDFNNIFNYLKSCIEAGKFL